MIHLNVLLTAKAGAELEVIADALRRAGELSQKEDGCLRWEAYQADAEPTRFLLVEQWASETALDQHRLGDAYTKIYQPIVLPLVDRLPLRGQRLI